MLVDVTVSADHDTVVVDESANDEGYVGRGAFHNDGTRFAYCNEAGINGDLSLSCS